MSESRRRKVRNESDGLSDTSFDDNIKQLENFLKQENDNIAGEINNDGGDSEYETVDETHSESEEDIEIVLHDGDDDIDESDEESQLDGSIILDLERQSGDGQEQDTKKVDDDEDRSNPQYIPKRGTFYEHDDRTAEDGAPDGAEAPSIEEEQEGKSVEKTIKSKKVWQQSQDRWTHDRYDDDEQAPKSRSELIAAYGYDIRNEEGPPRARRRRRYGRGPNKYTRNWEDEEAYGKAISANQRKPRPEDFPALGQQNSNSPRPETQIKSEENDTSKQINVSEVKEEAAKTNTSSPPLIQPQKSQQQIDIQQQNIKSVTSVRVQHTKRDRRRNGEIQNTKYESPKSYADYEKSNADSDNRSRRSRQSNGGNGIGKSNDDRVIKGFKNKNSTLEFKNQSRNKFNNHNSHSSQFSDNYTSDKSQNSGYYENVNDVDTNNIISQSFSNTKLKNEDTINLQHNRSDRMNSSGRSGNNSSGNSNHRSTNVIPPRLQNTEANRPKRYSSLRQRSVQEPPSGFQQQQPQPSYYPPEYQQQVNSQPDQTISVPTSVIQASSHIPVNGVQMTSVSIPQQQIPPQNMGVPPPGVPYTENTTNSQVISQAGAPPTVMPQQVLGGTYSTPVQYPPAAPYLIQQPLNFAVPPPQPPQFQPSFQPYSNYNGAPAQPAAALFQPQGGITYYSPQGQPMPPRPPQRRPTAAIPILPPPPPQPRARGRGSEQQNVSQQSGNPQEQENSHNIDHILDNMFVQRHPYNPMTDSTSSTVSNNGVSNITNQLNELNVSADVKDINSVDGKYINNIINNIDDAVVTSTNLSDDEIVTHTTTSEVLTTS